MAINYGLVPCFEPVTPCTNSIRFNVTNDNNGMKYNDDQNSRRRNFALVYIYYWMEMNANDATSDASPPLNNKDGGDGENKSLLGVCHGVRPLPMMEDVSGTTMSGKQWWQLWTA